MIIQLSNKFLYRLIRYFSQEKIVNSWRNDVIAEYLGVLPQTLSRQLKNQAIDISFLHRYLIAAGLITKNVPCPKLDTFDVYLKLLPIESQKRIMKELIND